MATPAQIQTALADSQAADLDWSQMAMLMKRAIINALVTSSADVELPAQVISSSGASISRMSITEAQALYSRFASMGSGGLVAQLAEFPE
jgi:hypothetical protein